MSGKRTIGLNQRRCDSKKKRKILCCEFDLWSQSRNWSEFIHEFISRHRVGSRRSEVVGDIEVGIAKLLSSVGESSLDSRSDKSYPGFQYSAV